MEIILIIGTVESAFLFLLLTGKRNQHLSDRALAFMFLCYTLSIGLTWYETYNANNNYIFPHMINLSWLILFLQGPALWLYVKSLTTPGFRLKPLHLLHLIPFFFFFAYHYFDFISLPPAEKVSLAATNLFKEKISYKISVMAIGIIPTGYNIAALLLIREFQKKLKLNYSTIGKIDLGWLRTLVIASIIVYLVNSLLFITDMFFKVATYQYLMLITYSFATIYIFVLGYFGLRQGNVFVKISFDAETQPHPNQLKAQITDPAPGEPVLINNLMLHMEKNQPYLDPEITLAKLGEQLNTKPEYLSEMLNKYIGQNFFDFINKHRIEEFKIQAMAEQNRHLSVMGIAYNCGFNSKASFYRAFKKFEGTTPTDYMSASHFS